MVRKKYEKIFRLMMKFAVLLIPFIYCNILQFYAASSCYGNLKALGSHFPAYRSYHDGQNPSSLHDLVDKEKWPQTRFSSSSRLCCPIDKGLDVSVSYIYRGDDLVGTNSHIMILVYERYPNHVTAARKPLRLIGDFFTFSIFAPRVRFVIRGDGVVMPMLEKEFKEAIEKDNEARINVGLPVKKVWLDFDEAGSTVVE